MNANTAQPRETMTDPFSKEVFHIMGDASDIKSDIESAIENELKKSPQAEAIDSKPVGLLSEPNPSYKVSSQFVEGLMENIIKAIGSLPSGKNVDEEATIRAVTKAYKNEYDISLSPEIITAAVMSAFGHIQTSRSQTENVLKRNTVQSGSLQATGTNG